MSNASRQSLRRVEFSHACDSDVSDLFGRTKDWLTTHGRVFMLGEVYGLSAIRDGGDIIPVSPLMIGTRGAEYWVRVGLDTLQEHAPGAAEELGVTDAGIEIGYGEPYHKVVKGRRGLLLRTGTIRFAPLAAEGGLGPVTYDVFEQGPGGAVNSLYTDANHEVPHGAGGPTELVTNEHQALLAVVQGLRAAAGNDLARQEFFW